MERKPITKEEKEVRKKAIIEKQTKDLEIIDRVCDYFDKALNEEHQSGFSFRMADVITYLEKECGISIEENKRVSQYNYLIINLASARLNKYIDNNSCNIKVLYIKDRMKEGFKRELHGKIVDIINAYSTLFHWDTGCDGSNYEHIEEEEK